MKRLFLLLLVLLVSAGSLRADWLIFKNGLASEVLAVELTDLAVNTVTLTGQRWSVLQDAVDIARTRRANRMSGDTRLSPGWSVIVGVPGEPAPSSPAKVSRQAAPATPPPPSPVPAPPPEAPVPAPPPEAPMLAPPPPRAPVPAPAATTSLPKPSRQQRFAVYVNGAIGTEQVRFEETHSFELFSEQASIDSVYRDPKQRGVELGGLFRVKGPFGVGASVELFQNDRDAVYSASIPHPFFFDRFRQFSGAESGLTSQETAVHLDAFVTKTWGPISIDVFGGPSWFFTKTELLVDVLYEEAFPFDTVEPRGTQLQVFENRPIGFNVGASATYRFGGIFGLDMGLRYSKAKTTLFINDGREIQLDAGGLRLGAGLRFLFP